MASRKVRFQMMMAIATISIPTAFTATVVEDLNNLQPPPDFNSTIAKNCRQNPSLRYCNSTNLLQIFKSTIVASHLCNISNNPNCVESFPKIDLRGHPKIAPLYLSFTFFWKFCPLTVVSIDLSNNSLKGSFPNDVLYCSQIRSLDLSLNTLSGDVPVEKLSSLQNLTLLNLSYNAFSQCDISETPFFDRFNSSGFVRSGILPDRRQLTAKAVVLFVGFPAALLFFGWLCFWRESCRNEHRFKASALEEASNGFSERNLVGKSNGRRSVCYRGVLRDGREVRIEVEVWSEKTKREDRRRFVEESEALVQLQHRNIVRVLGYCDSRKLTAVVMEWIAGKDVEAWVRICVPPWKQRVRAILGIAAAVRYLHEEWPEIGCDLRSTSVMVSENGEAVVTRFKFDDHCKMEIGKRFNITAEDRRCCCCQTEEETGLHFFLECAEVRSLWNKMVQWSGTSWAAPRRIKDHFVSFAGLLGGGKSKYKMGGLWICFVWVWWKWRNAVRHENKEWDFRRIEEEIKCRFWSWCLVRGEVDANWSFEAWNRSRLSDLWLVG